MRSPSEIFQYVEIDLTSKLILYHIESSRLKLEVFSEFLQVLPFLVEV